MANYTGTNGNDFFVGPFFDDGNNDSVFGGAGDDFLGGKDGNDTLDGGSGDDSVVGDSGNDFVFGGTGFDTVSGLSGNDTLVPGAGGVFSNFNDFERLLGGTGNDLYDLRGVQPALSEDPDPNVIEVLQISLQEAAGEGADTVFADKDFELGFFSDPSIETIQLFGTGNFFASGDSRNNRIIGNTGNNELKGFAGSDTLEGKDGDDTLNGNGGGRADTLNPTDVLIGGKGNDFYSITNPADVVELVNEGFDTVQSDLNSFTLPAFVENGSILAKPTSLLLRGNFSNNFLFVDDRSSPNPTNAALVLDGLEGRDTLVGGDRLADILNGGPGDDSITFVHPDTNFFPGPRTGTGRDSLSGGTGNDILLSGADDDTLDGGSENDSLDGGSGRDSMIGGSGNDTLRVDNSGDSLVEAAGGGFDLAKSTISFVLPANVENLLLEGTASRGTGNSAANQITGNGFANNLDGALGADTLIGGSGNDTYFIDNRDDTVIETSSAATEIDTVESKVSFILGDNLERLNLVYSTPPVGFPFFVGVGNALNNRIQGGNRADSLIGAGGADTLSGNDGNDTLVVDSADDLVIETNASLTQIDTVESTLSFTLGDNLENLVLKGVSPIEGNGNTLANFIFGNLAGNNLSGGPGNDTLNGNAGADVLNGSTGSDTYFIDDPGDVIVEIGSASDIDTVISTLTHTLDTSLENLSLIGAAPINGFGNLLDNRLTGNSAANILNGGGGNDSLDGGLGVDTMTGGGGNDAYVVDSSGDQILEGDASITEIDQVTSPVTFTLPANVENLTLIGLNAIDGIGNNSPNRILGNAGANSINGSNGIDTMEGGLGNDTYRAGLGDIVIENNTSTSEVDLVLSADSFSLAGVNNVEDLQLLGSVNRDGTGNELGNGLTGNSAANRLEGAAGDDILDGRAGADTLIGGTGNDTYLLENAGDQVIETSTLAGEIDLVESAITFTIGTNLEKLTLTGNAAINGTGNESDNSITGNNANNTLTGLGGRDTLNGAAGADFMSGGPGDDTYFVDNIGDVVDEPDDGGNDVVISSVDRSMAAHLEEARVLGNKGVAIRGNDKGNRITGGGGNDTLIGNPGADTLNGSAGKDLLDGGSSHDRMLGGKGDDLFVVNSREDKVVEFAGAGSDSIHSSVSLSFRSFSQVENLKLLRPARDGVGNARNNQIVGNSLDNRLDGEAGDDTLVGARNQAVQTDTLVGGTGADLFVLGKAKHGRFYADGGKSDYARISDFTVGTDQLQLKGKASQYSLGATDGQGTRLFFHQHGDDELIAILKSGNSDALAFENTIKETLFV